SEIATCIAGHLRADSGTFGVTRRDRYDMGADCRPQRQKERHRGEPVILLCAVQVAVEDAVGKMLEPAMLQIHQQKGQVVEDICAGESLVELQAIEKGRLALKQADVPEMQITVTMADFAGGTPSVEQPCEGR